MDLNGKTALVTGAAGGMGTAIVAGLVDAGADVVGLDLNFEPGLHDRGASWEVQCDLTEEDSVESCLDLVLRNFPGVDILVNNAGIFPFAAFEEAPLTLWREVFAINVEAVVRMTKACLPHMRQQQWGRILMLGSNTQYMGWPGLCHYTASKGALTGLMRSLSTEVGDDGVTVNMVYPTITETPGTSEMFSSAPQVVDSVVARQAIHRPGQPRDVADLIVFLASAQAGFITGQTIAADGGLAKL